MDDMKRNPLKMLIKAIFGFLRFCGRVGANTYISPLAELRGTRKIFLGDDVVLERHARLCANGAKARITVGRWTTIAPYALLKCNEGVIKIGDFCSVNDYTTIYGYGGVHIGNHVHIAGHVTVVASDHKPENLGNLSFSVDLCAKGIVIEDNVWIGANVVVLDGVRIGTGSVIGAGAVVSRDIPPRSLAVGVPARVIKNI
jgi:acetyltransferase-like isoleucine patch superfamily enzyme